jgi:hypothetical protein
MWFATTTRKSCDRPLFMEKMEESADDLGLLPKASRLSAITRTCGILTIGCFVIITLIFSAGFAIGLAHSQDISVRASRTFLASAAQYELAGNTEIPRNIITRAVGWTWWNGQQFGAWIGLGTALFGFAATVANPGAWVAGVGGGLCYLIAIAGGATASRSIHGHNTINIKGDYGGRVTIGLQPVNMSSALHNWALPANLAWHKVMDNHTANTYLAHDGTGAHGLVSMTPSSISKRNDDNDFVLIDEGEFSNDYAYLYLRDGNSAREYYYDHSYADWTNYMPGLQYWLIDGEGTNQYQQFCMVPQDSQGNAVAAISVQTNSNNPNIAGVCAQEAEEANGSFKPN